MSPSNRFLGLSILETQWRWRQGLTEAFNMFGECLCVCVFSSRRRLSQHEPRFLSLKFPEDDVQILPVNSLRLANGRRSAFSLSCNKIDQNNDADDSDVRRTDSCPCRRDCLRFQTASSIWSGTVRRKRERDVSSSTKVSNKQMTFASRMFRYITTTVTSLCSMSTSKVY